MRTALKPGTIININGIEYSILSLLNASGGMSLIYEARQCIGPDGYAGKTVIKEFFPATKAIRKGDGRVYCASQEEGDIQRFQALRQGMISEGIIGEDARDACSQVYAFDHAWDGYAVMRKMSTDTISLTELLNAWQAAPPRADEEYADIERLRYALRIVHSILTGLQTIHSKAGIIHRDISLGNIVWASADFARDGRDGRAYFLDFGSALRMNDRHEAQNVSDPLDLFGTYSFAAPEIWQLNGTLTPAADLFSVSAILLLLCCGKKCCIRMKPGWHLASQANVGRLYESDYVIRSSVEKLNIPPDIRGRLFDLLQEGLSRDPAKRFEQSALKMLEAVETLQIKCAPRQRLREYVAFISYHHRPLDKAVARRLHRQIEQYRIPAEFAKDREDRKLGLVFRDEDELPVSTDLTDNIQEALDHSDFLIVVCTPGTPKSIWVEQEIAYFLRHHDRNHILAVLAEGRPEESFPPHLVHLFDENDNVVGDTEYLAASIAGKTQREVLRNLSREKIRIIAAMLGCPYDALYQREKRYRVQRLALSCGIVAVALALFSMVIVTKNAHISEQKRVIAQQNDEVLINESIALSREAKLNYQNGDVIGALECALKASPDEDNARPYTPVSEQVLSDVLSPYGFGRVNIRSILYQDTSILRIELDEDASTVYSMDQYGCVRAFEIDSGALKWRSSLSMPSISFDGMTIRLLRSPHAVFANSGKEIVLLNADDGSVIWRKDIANRACQISDDEQTLLLFDSRIDEETHYEAHLYRISDGERLRSVDCDAACLSDSTLTLEYAANYACVEDTFHDANHYYGISYDADAFVAGRAEAVLFAIAGGVSARVLHRWAFEAENDGFDLPIALKYYKGSNRIMVIFINSQAQKFRIEMVSADDGELLYSREYLWSATGNPSYRCFTSSETHAYLGLNNDLFCFDVETGEMLAKALDNSTQFGIAHMDEDISNACYIVTESGLVCLVAYMDGSINFANFDHQRLELGAISNVSFGNERCITPIEGAVNFATGYVAELNPNGLIAAVPSAHDTCILIYRPCFGNDCYIDGIGVDWSEYLMDSTGRFLLDRDKGNVFDLVDQRCVQLPDWVVPSDYDDIAFSAEKQCITYLSEDCLCIYSLENDAVERVKLNEAVDLHSEYALSEATLEALLEDENSFLNMENSPVNSVIRALMTPSLKESNDAAITVCEDGSALACLFLDGELSCWKDGQVIDTAPIPELTPGFFDTLRWLSYSSIKVMTDGVHVVISNAQDANNPFLLIYNLREGQWKLAECEPSSEYLSVSNIEHAFSISKKGGKLAYITSGDDLVVYDLEDGSLTMRVPMSASARSMEDMRFFDDDKRLLCVLKNSAIAFDIATGARQDCEYPHMYKGASLLSSLCNITTDKENGRLYISDPTGAEEGIGIDVDSWTRIATVPYHIAYSAATDAMLIYDFPGYWHPNIVGYVTSGVVPPTRRGICSMPSKSLNDLRREGMSIIHPNV